MKRLLCLFLEHDLEPIESLSPFTTKMHCHRCGRDYAHTVADGDVTLMLLTEAMERDLRRRRRASLEERTLSCKGARC